MLRRGERQSSALGMENGMHSSAGSHKISYWVLVPELGTDVAVAGLRGSWFRELHPTQVHYCVANGSASRDATLHRLPVWRGHTTPASREAFFGNGRLLDANRREVYNSFLRRKVFALMQSMSALAIRGAFDYGMLLDSDTAVNVSNLEHFVRAIPNGGRGVVYTGRCQQGALAAARGRRNAVAGDDQGAQSGSHRRQDVARYIEMSRRQRPAPEWPGTIPPSPGGGPGLLFSRGLLVALHSQIDRCEHLTEWNAMGDSIFAGGDSMITRCLASLGVRCANEHDMHIDVRERCPFLHGCALSALFRKNPPWFYQAVGQQWRSFRSAKQAQHFGMASPLHETVAFHHVKPSIHSSGMGPDPRCAVRMRADPNGRAGWWGSSCLPHFCLVGAPHSGVDGLLRTLQAHPEVVAPSFASLDFFAPHGPAEHLLGELPLPRSDAQGPRAAARSMWSRLLRLYAGLFPTVDPRDFRLTGEASSTYLYSSAAPMFFSHPHFRLLRLVIVLREPAARVLADLSNSVSQQAQGIDHAIPMIRRARMLASRCGVAVLYAACAQCQAPRAVGSATCAREASMLSTMGLTIEAGNSSSTSAAWTALWQSWYHLFLPRWLAMRPHVVFAEQTHGTAARSVLRDLGAFVRLVPPVLRGESLIADAGIANASAEVINALQELTADAVAQTDALLQPKSGVPDEWRVWRASGRSPPERIRA